MLDAAQITSRVATITAGAEKLNATGACEGSSDAGERMVAGLGVAVLAGLVAVVLM